MDKETCLVGVACFAIGLVAFIEGNFGASVFMMVLGLGFIAVGLGKEYVKELFETFKAIFEGMWKVLTAVLPV